MKQNNPTTNIIVVAVLVAIVAGAGGFFGGMKYQQNKRGQLSTFTTNNQGRTGGPQNMMNARNGFRPVAGEIIKADEKTITVKLRDGSSKIVLLSSSSQVNKAVLGSVTDLEVGTQVSVFGSQNADGSVTAQNIQIASTAETVTPMPTK